jgi:hypothetical protein
MRKDLTGMLKLEARFAAEYIRTRVGGYGGGRWHSGPPELSPAHRTPVWDDARTAGQRRTSISNQPAFCRLQEESFLFLKRL